MRQQIRLSTLVLAGAVAAGMGFPRPAEAGSKGRRNTAIVLGAASVYGIVKKKPELAAVAGGGAIYSYMKSRDAARKERRERDRRYRRAAYRRGAARSAHRRACARKHHTHSRAWHRHGRG